ncbi:alpha/beta hydrolase family esterase [Roseovarius sp. S4756]|uniref:extracellular catalytic domain type 1 short-chain-length polyhydroxyalkanoate depolymerase n=1 Tax=Roseovarius maritimus TaxID=3342637 RepID=UPI00372B2953
MFDFNAGAGRPVNDAARLERRAAAQDLVQRTLARHGLVPSGSPTQHGAQGLTGLLQNVLPKAGLDLGTGASPQSLLIPEGAEFLLATHQGRSGSRAYRTYVPALAEAGVSGIVMMLHGCTQTPEDFAIGTGMNALADLGGFIVIYPEQSRGANAQTCWNWFSPNDQRRDRGEPEILAGIARKAMSDHDVPPTRIFVAGLSAGAAMAVILGQTHPDVFAAVGAHSGLPYGAAKDVASAFAAMAGQGQHQHVTRNAAHTRTIAFHGSADSTVQPANGAAIIRDADERAGPSQIVQTTHNGSASGRAYSVTTSIGPDGRNHLEHWVIDGLGHAWSGGQPGGSYTDRRGPDASAEMVRFFFDTKD